MILALSISSLIAVYGGGCSSVTYTHTNTPSPQTQTVTVNGNTVFQTISGWGASTGYSEGVSDEGVVDNPNLTAALADCFWSTSNGSCANGNSIGLEWVRIQDNYTANSTPDAPTILLAQARGASVLLGFNPSVAISSSNYSSMAAYDIAKIQYWQSQGVTINAIAVINEPQNTGTTAAAIDTFIASYLYPQMVSAGLGSIEIIMPESADWFATDYVTTCMDDSNCGPHISAIAGHGGWNGFQNGASTVDGFYIPPGPPYWSECCVDYAVNPPPFSTAGKPLWQTEENGGASGPCDGSLATYDASMNPDALTWAHNIHDFLTTLNGSLWLYWNLVSGYSCNDGLWSTADSPAQRFYAVGNWSRFVRPGQVRISATANPQTNVYVTAFKNSSTGTFEIVAINGNSSAASQTYSLTGLSASTVTPWITDSSLDLIQQSAVSASGNSFTYTLPAMSVTTFVGSQ